MTANWTASLHTRSAALLGVAALTLSACSAEPHQDGSPEEHAAEREVAIDADPVQVQSSAEEADLGSIHLPVHLKSLLSVDPGWDAPPQVHDGVFLAPGEQEGRLVFRAVDSDGTVLWTAERPLSCSGFALTSAGDRPLAVLTDLSAASGSADTDDSPATWGTTTATAYDLHTGEEVWGPVDVPGPHQGPGLVFAERSEEPLGGTGRRVALDAATGEPSPDGVDVIGEFYGTTVSAEDGEIVASTSGSSQDLWRSSASSTTGTHDAETLISPATNRLPPGSALIGSPEEGYDLWDLTTGQILAEGTDDAMFDLMSQTWVAVREDELTGIDSEGEELWAADVGAEPTLLGTGGVMTYVLSGEEDLEIYNVVTGNPARVYDPLEDGETAVPLAFTASGATALDTGTQMLLVTDVPGPPEDNAEEGDSPDEGP